ncbi:hypothetical protein GUITHDRAFT_141135 [Guillardia theta CCMP2712]|uniref:SMCHD1 ribosomal S5 domain-containing protein n=1 Tax=Guillardia theta (strain CCMP2712) TaxID=905079 RepID=L1J2X7_GUITC|nr:hypothetical protein GUITHDRAFT_141135 [Guillardia theta CCMP2712]EKX42445.1 hypothetical protein GUITHDRAFT_141135 [Guillardia theta CCMP2712]|eukprot:XP_005829425.1 hypothetical protein GUITHDRAFT_141135 [Guillardia theta CCMP2712]
MSDYRDSDVLKIYIADRIRNEVPRIESPIQLKCQDFSSIPQVLAEVKRKLSKLGWSGEEELKLCAMSGEGGELKDFQDLLSNFQDSACEVRLVYDVNDTCEWITSIAPNKRRLIEGSISNYTFLSALGELLDNAIEAVMQTGIEESKKIEIIIDLIQKRFSLHDNGVGCADPKKLLQYGSARADVQRRYDPSSRSFLRYFGGSFSRYGVGSKNACNLLGKTIRIISKSKGSMIENSVKDSDPNAWIASSFARRLEDAGMVNASYCKIVIDEFDTTLLETGSLPADEGILETIKSLRMMYFMYLGVNQSQGSKPGFYLMAQKILRACQETCVCENDVQEIRNIEVTTRMVNDKNKLIKAIQLLDEAKTLPHLELNLKVTSEGQKGHEVVQEMTVAHCASSCCLDTLLSDAAVDCFPLYLDLREYKRKDLVFKKTMVMGAVFYFPKRNNSETIQFVDRLFGLSCAEHRRFMTFWMGRWLLADQFMPEFMQKSKSKRTKLNISADVRNRAFGIMFVDRDIAPEADKTKLHQREGNLSRVQKAFKDKVLSEAYDTWLLLCHRKYDEEITFEDEDAEFDTNQRIFTHQSITFSGKKFNVGDYVEVFEAEEAHLENKDKKSLLVGQIRRFLQHRNSLHQGKVEILMLETNNRFENVEQKEIPDWSMRLIDAATFEEHKEKNKGNLASEVFFVQSKKRIRAGDQRVLKLECRNHLGARIDVNPMCTLHVIFHQEDMKQEKFVLPDRNDPFGTDPVFLTKAGEYTVSLESTLPHHPIACTPLRFRVVAGDVSKVKMNDDVRVVSIRFGRQSSFKATLYDEYDNVVSPQEMHKPRIKLSQVEQSFSIASRPPQLQVETTLHEDAIEMKILEARDGSAGKFKATLIVTSESGSSVHVDFDLEVQHGDPQCIEVEPVDCSQGLELTNLSELPDISCSIKDRYSNPCDTIGETAKMFVTSTDLRLESSYISCPLFAGKCILLMDKRLQSLYFNRPADKRTAKVKNCSVVSAWGAKKKTQEHNQIGANLNDTWRSLLEKQEEPAGFFCHEHGFFTKGDWLLVRLDSDQPNRYKYQQGRLESVSKERGRCCWWVKYFNATSDSSRLLVPAEGGPEMLNIDRIQKRILVLHHSLMDRLDVCVLNEDVYFACCDECTADLQASLDFFLHSDDKLLHRRMSFPLKTSGTPVRFLISQQGKILGEGDALVVIEVDYGTVLDNLFLLAKDETMQPCIDLKETVEVRCSWQEAGSPLKFRPAKAKKLLLPEFVAKQDETYSININNDNGIPQDLKIQVRVNRGEPALLRLQVERDKVVVGESFSLRGFVCDRNGLVIDNFGDFDIDHETYTFKFETNEREEREILMKDSQGVEVSGVKAKGNITTHDNDFQMRNVYIKCKPARGTFRMEMKIKPKKKYAQQWYVMKAIESQIELHAGKASEIMLDGRHTNLFPLQVPSNLEYLCEIFFQVTDCSGNNLSEHWDTDLTLDIPKSSSAKLQKWREQGRETVYRLARLPPLPKGQHKITLKSKKLKSLELVVVSMPGNTVQQLGLEVEPSVKHLQATVSGDRMTADFTAKITFHTEDGQELKFSSEIPDVKLVCSANGKKDVELGTTPISFEGNQLICMFSLNEVGNDLKIKAVFEDTRLGSSKTTKSTACKVKVEPGPVHCILLPSCKLEGSMNRFTFSVHAADRLYQPTSYHPVSDWKLSISPRVLEVDDFEIEAEPVQLSSSCPGRCSSFRLKPRRWSDGRDLSRCTVCFDTACNFDPPVPSKQHQVNLVHYDTVTDDAEDVDGDAASFAEEEEERTRATKIEISRCRNELEQSQRKIKNCLQTMPTKSCFSHEITQLSLELDAAADAQKGQVCERWLSKVRSIQRELEEKATRWSKATFLPCKYEAKIPQGHSCLGCPASLYQIDDSRATELQVAISTAFGAELSTLVFSSSHQMNKYVEDRLSRNPDTADLRAIALPDMIDSPDGASDEVPRAALGRANKFVRQVRAGDAMLDSLARRFFGRLVVFELHQDARAYRAAAGEMAVGLDAPNNVLLWNGSRVVASKEKRSSNVLGVANDYMSRTQQKLKEDTNAAGEIDRLLREIKDFCTSMAEQQEKINALEQSTHLSSVSTAISVSKSSSREILTPKRGARHAVREVEDEIPKKRLKDSPFSHR